FVDPVPRDAFGQVRKHRVRENDVEACIRVIEWWTAVAGNELVRPECFPADPDEIRVHVDAMQVPQRHVMQEEARDASPSAAEVENPGLRTEGVARIEKTVDHVAMKGRGLLQGRLSSQP